MAEEDFQVTLNKREIEKIAGSGEMRDALAIIGIIAEGEAKRLAPVDTGNLRRSITSEVSRDRRGWLVRFGTNVFYGIFQEFGTIHHPAQPFLRPVLPFLRRQL